MNTIHVNASTPYDVHIQKGLLKELGSHLTNLKTPCKTVIVTDDNVAMHYLETVSDELSKYGYEVLHYVFPHGESSKNATELLKIVEFLAAHCISRSDLIIALGGGVVGDMAGFAAATYLRGIDYVQVPTSLLAAVDSSVGGKTAVNLEAGKNLWGAFKQPIAVYFDPNTLTTLPQTEFINGCGEIIKYGMIGHPELLDALEKEPLTLSSSHLEDIIALCVQAKATIVEEDETESGVRQLLNFGHTFAHGIEKVSQFEVHHGYAVAIGMALITKGTVAVDHLDPAIYERLCHIITSHELPVSTDLSVASILAATKNDKKSHGKSINIIVPTSWGHSTIKKINHDDLSLYIQ